MDESDDSTDEPLRTQIEKRLAPRNILLALGVLAVLATPPVMNLLFPEAGLEAAPVIVSGLLSLALVFLYFQQQNMLERQTDLMEREYDTFLLSTNQVYAKGDTIYTSVRNAGRGYIRAIWLKSEVVSTTNSVECEPGYSQMKILENGQRGIPGLSDETNLKGEVKIAFYHQKSEKPLLASFRHFTNELANEGIGSCVVKLSMVVSDEDDPNTESQKPIELAEQRIELKTRETTNDESEKEKLPRPTKFSEGISPYPERGMPEVYPYEHPHIVWPDYLPEDD